MICMNSFQSTSLAAGGVATATQSTRKSPRPTMSTRGSMVNANTNSSALATTYAVIWGHGRNIDDKREGTPTKK